MKKILTLAAVLLVLALTGCKKEPVLVSSVTLDKAELILKAGETAKLVATVLPENAEDKTITWATSDASIATVAEGVVTAVASGVATITATSGEQNATCEVVVAGALSLKANIADNYARYISFMPEDVLGVFVTAGEATQSNLKYTPAEVGEADDFGTMFMLTKEVPSSALVAGGEPATFSKGEHTVYAYLPYVEAADIKAVPVKDLTTQDITGVGYGKQFLQTDWIFQYAKTTVKSLDPVELNLVCPYTQVNNGAVRSDYFTLPAEAASLALKSITITANGTIAYKNPSFDLTTEKFNGEAVNTISLVAKKSSTSISAKFALCCDKATALKYDYTIDITLENGDVYTATAKLVESTVAHPIDWDKDLPSVKFSAPAAFTKK